MRKRNPEQEARRTSLIALFMLIKSPRSGYDIRLLIDKWNLTEYIPVSSTTVYRALARIEKKGYVESYEEKRGKYPVATVYRITEAGREAYKRMVDNEAEFADTAYAANIFLGLATPLGLEVRRNLARKWQEKARTKIQELTDRIEDHTENSIYGKPFPEWLLLDHERHQLTAEVEWMDKFCNSLEDAMKEQ